MRSRDQLRGAQQRSITALYEHVGQQAVVPMGGGKTASAQTAILEMKEDNVITCALVMAPKKVCQLVWGPGREHTEWEHLAGMKIQLVNGTPAQRKKKLLEPGFDIYVVGKDVTQWLVGELAKLPPWHPLFDVLCIDEISTFKSPRGKRFKAMKTVIKKFRTVWGLTGSPRPNSYADQYPLMKLITRDEIWPSNFDKWRMERFTPENPFDLQTTSWTVRPEWEQRIVRDISRWSFTVCEKDLPELDPIQPVYHWVDLPKKVMQQYKDMEKHLLVKEEGWSVLAQTRAVASGKLSQIVQGFMYAEDGSTIQLHTEKTDMLADLLEGLNGDSSLIAYEFLEDLRRIKAMVPDIPWFGNGTTDKQTFQFEADWNAKRSQFLALHPASAGHGLNLQFGGSQCIMYGMTWSAELFAQLLKRFHRPGQKFQCFVHYIFARDTVDCVKFNRVHHKMSEEEAFRAYLKQI
jgi:hypothetical protein